MAATVWKGHLTFGLVSVPVRLFRAARAEKVSLHRLYRPGVREPDAEAVRQEPARIAALNVPGAPKTRGGAGRTSAPEPEPESEPAPAPVTRIRQAAIDPVANAPISSADIVKGFEYSKGQYAVIDEEDIRKITPQTAAEMQIVEFVRFGEIDPVYLETSYYMAPEEAGEKAYALLFEAMRETGYVALAQVAMHRREHVMILRPGKKGIITHTMFYPDEVRTIQEFRTDAGLLTPKELGLARTLIETLAAPFEPEKFKDTYRERLKQLIEAKVEGRQVAEAETPPPAKVVDIMEALEKSLAAAKDRKPAKPERAKTRKRQPAAG